MHSTPRHSPPQFSRLKRLLKLWLTNGEIFFRSWVRTLVARSDWWASLKVVSISSRPWWARTALANPSGPSLSNTSRKPTGGSPSGAGEESEKERVKEVNEENNTVVMKVVMHINVAVDHYQILKKTSCSKHVQMWQTLNMISAHIHKISGKRNDLHQLDKSK